jgi:hypothetical protein
MTEITAELDRLSSLLVRNSEPLACYSCGDPAAKAMPEADGSAGVYICAHCYPELTVDLVRSWVAEAEECRDRYLQRAELVHERNPRLAERCSLGEIDAVLYAADLLAETEAA